MNQENIFKTIKYAPQGEEQKKEQENKIEDIRTKYQELEKWGSILLGTSGWNVEISPSIPTAAADFENRILYFGTKCENIIADPDKNKEKVKRTFVFSHELIHFDQGLEAPEEYLSTFDIAEEKAKEFSEKYEANYKDLRKSFGTFFNIFLDIDDNGKVIRRNKILQDDIGKEVIRDLYQKLFSENNLSNIPLNEQFMYKAIMVVMDEERNVETTSEINDLMDNEFQYLGKQYSSLIEFIKKEIYNPDISFKKSLFRIKSILQPQFEELLKKDLEQGNYRPPEKKEGGGMDEGIGKNKIKDFIKKILKENPNTQTKAKEQMKKDFKKKAKKDGFLEKDMRKMEKIMRNTNDVWPQMMDLWEKFFSKSESYEYIKEAGFSSGNSISVKRFISDLPKFVQDPNLSKPFEREVVTERTESWQPKKISLIFTTDLSGSMDSEKRQAVQEAYYCIAKSFIQFQRNQIIKSEDGKSPVNAYIRNIGFGDSMQDLLELTAQEKEERIINPENESLDKRIWKSILDIGVTNLKGNNNPNYLYEIEKEAEKSKENLEKGEESMIIIELTDGDPDNNVKHIAKKIILKLNKNENVYCRAIRIGGSSNDFQDIWGEYGEVLPDKDVDNLKGIFMKILKDIFNKQN